MASWTCRGCGAFSSNDLTPEPAKPPGKPPQLCDACQYRIVFEALRKQDCIVAGDIGCYTLGVLQPFEAMDSCVCMGASLGVGLGLRHVLARGPGPARRERHRRQHLRPQRHQRAGGDGL